MSNDRAKTLSLETPFSGVSRRGGAGSVSKPKRLVYAWSMRIRQARPEDKTAIYLMGYDTWSEGHDRDAYLSLCESSRRYSHGLWWVLEGDPGDLRSSLVVYDLYGGRLGLASIATVPAHRRQGAASRLIEGVCAAYPEAMFFLFSSVGETLYGRLGFRALPAIHQHVPGQSCMVRASSAQWDALLSDPTFQAPSYF